MVTVKRCRRLAVLVLLFALVFSAAFAQNECRLNESCQNATSPAFQPSPAAITVATVAKGADEGKICVVFFYGNGCPACAKAEPFMKELEKKYSDKINVHWLEIYQNLKNYQLFNEFCGIKEIPIEKRGIPTVLIGERYLVGVEQIEKNLEDYIKEEIGKPSLTCPLEGKLECHSGTGQAVQVGTAQVSPAIPNFLNLTTVSLPLIVGAGLVDGINPCAFAVLIFLLTYLMTVSSDRKKIIGAGIAYIASVYVSYFLAGLGLLAFIQISGVSRILYKVAAFLALFSGAVNVKDYFFYGKGFSLKIPESKKPLIRELTGKANIPAAIVLGFLVSMFELPCTGGIYLAILALLSISKTEAIYYLLVYNLMFVVPLLIILALIYLGMKTEHIKNWKESHKNLMKLGMGILLLALGLMMLLGG